MADSTSSLSGAIASSVVVRNIRGQGSGSLRQAIAQAQSGDGIRFAPSLRGQTIVLTRGQLEIIRHLTLDGTQAPGLALSGNRRKNQQSPGEQALGINEVVWLGWRNQLHQAVNDGRAGFQANRDLLINGTSLVWPRGDAQAGTLTVGDYFV